MKHGLKKILSSVMAGVLCVGLLSQTALTTVSAADGYDGRSWDEILGTTRTFGTFDASYLSVSGYASAEKYGVGDRSNYKEGDPEYAVVTNSDEFLQALIDARSDKVEVIEVRADIDLGWLALTDLGRTMGCIGEYEGANGSAANNTVGCSHTNPDLMRSGISCVDISSTEGLTIFSTKGYALQHAEFKIQSSSRDIVIRNLRFEGMWEWDDRMPGSYGGDGNHKRVGWTTMKVNSADRIWLDHCDFGIAMDGCVDISGTQTNDGCEGISITWCTYGKESLEPGSMIYNTIEYLEDVYQKSKVDSSVVSFGIYGALRDAGFTKEECMLYGYLHSKCMLTGDGDKDYDKNPLTRYTLAYNQYYNMQQRVPMVRQGSVHMYNCYIDYNYMNRRAIVDKYSSTQVPEYTYTNNGETKTGTSLSGYISDVLQCASWRMFRAMDARNGGSIAADTCVYRCVDSAIIGSEKHTSGSNLQDDHDFGYNHALIINSSISKWSGGQEVVKVSTSEGGSNWDNNGVNDFISSDYWDDKSTIGNWTWKELTPEYKADGVSDNNKAEYDQYINQKDDTLPYDYKMVELDKVEEVVKTYGGCGVLEMSANDWLKTTYDASYEIQFVEEDKDEATEVVIDATQAAVFLSERLQLHATVAPETTADKSVTWTSSDESIAKVTTSGLVCPVQTGDVTITATTKNGKTTSCQIQVVNLPESIEVTGVPNIIYVGDVYKAEASITPVLADDSLIWSTNLVKKISITEDGWLTALDKANNAMIMATSPVVGNMVWNKTRVVGSKSVRIKECPVPVESVALDVTSACITLDSTGSALALKATVLPADATNSKVVWESSDESVAIVSGSVVIPVSTGTAVITVRTINGAKIATCEAVVTAPAVSGDVDDGDNGDSGNSGDNKDDAAGKMGDITDDEYVDTLDAIEVLKYAAGMDSVINEDNKSLADVNQDTFVDTLDAIELLKHAAGMDSVLDKKEE